MTGRRDYAECILSAGCFKTFRHIQFHRQG